MAVDDLAVRRDLLARADDEDLAGPEFGGGDSPLRAVLLEHRDLLRPKFEQRLERGAGAPLRARLEVAPREDEGDDDGRDLEVDVGPCALLGDQLEAHPHAGSPAPRKKSAITDQPSAVNVPSEISVSMVAAPCLRFCQAAR